MIVYFRKAWASLIFTTGPKTALFPLGEIQLMGRNDPDTINWMGETFFPGKSYAELKWMSIDFWLTSEDLPSPDNRVLLEDGSIKVVYNHKLYSFEN